MSKDTTPLNDLPTAQVNESMQNSMDSFGNILSVPVRKLDADEYTANDLDGVTESATGSGNLNFLMMQAGQTNEAMSNLNPFNVAGGDHVNFNAMNGAASGSYGLPGTENGFDTAMDRGFDGTNDFDGQGQLNNTGSTSSNAGSLGASNLAANTTFANPFSSTTSFSSSSSSATETGGPPIPPINGANGSNGTSGTDGTSGNSGTDGTNGTDGTGTTIINIDDRVFETVENIVNESITNLGDVINQTTTNLGDVVNNATTNLFDTINNTTNNVTNILNNIINNNGGGLGPIGLNLDLLVDNITNINLDIINGSTITNVLNETLNTAPILAPVQNLLGNLLSHTSLDVLINPFQPDTGAGDTDLHVGTNLDVLGIHIPDIGIDIPLDIAEGLLGDIDIGLDLTNDLLGGLPILGDILGGGGGNGDTDLAVGGLGGILGADVLNDAASALLNPVENLLGDVDIGGVIGLDLLGLGSGQTGPDSDISIPINIALIDSPLLNDGLNVSLDPLESIVGDIDLDLGVAGNILGNVAPNLFDNALGGNGQNDLLTQIGDGVSDLAGGVLPIGNGADTDLALGTGVDLLDGSFADNGLGLVLNPIEDLVGDMDIGGAIGLDLLGTASDGGEDSDLTLPIDFYIVDAPLLNDDLDINLDPLESIVGDIDIDLGVAGNLLGDVAPDMFDDSAGGSGSNALLEQVGDGLSDLSNHLLPFGNGSDTDIAFDTGIDAGGFETIANGLDIVLDPVETITGDIDLIGSLGIGLLGTGGSAGADSDLMIDTGIIYTVEIDLDFVEAVTSDIDLGIDLQSVIGDTLGGGSGGLDEILDTAIGLLDSSAPNTGGLDLGAITSDLTGGGTTDPLDAITSWTETIIPNAGDLLGGGLHIDPVSSIPDPVLTTPVLSLPPVPAVPSVPVLGGLLGGLGGHHGHGGLFG